MKTKVINLWGGPGCGKSTLAAGVYHRMKACGSSVELVREYVKAWAWRGDRVRQQDELYIFAKQHREEANLYGKVEYIITDRPLGLSVIYEQMYNPGSHLMLDVFDAVRAQHQDVEQVDLLVCRTREYQTEGRFEALDAALKVDLLCRDYLKNPRCVMSIDAVLEAL